MTHNQVSPTQRMRPQLCWKKHDRPIRVSPKAGFLSLADAKRKCLKRMRAGLVYCVPIPRRSPGWFLSVCPWERHGQAWITKALEDVPHLCPRTRAPCAVGQGSGSVGWLRRGAGTPWAGCGPPVGCQHSDGTTLGVLKSPQTRVFHIVHVLIQSPVFLLFSVAFGLGHKALNQHSAEPGKSKGLKHLIRTRHFLKIIPCLGNYMKYRVGFRRTKRCHFHGTSANPDVLCRAPGCGL